MNNVANITCPKCGADIPLTDALFHRIREELAREFDQQRQAHNAALAERQQKLEAEKSLLKQRAQSLQETVSAQVEAERQKLLAQARQQAEQTFAVELSDLRSQLADQKSKLQDAHAAELELRRQKREVEEDRANVRLTVTRQLDADRAQIAEVARQQAIEAEQLKMADKDHKIKDLQLQIAALQQRAEQSSMQFQGETLELALENDLRRAFPYDQVVGTKAGERGADILQRVRTNCSLDCGAILWEAKRAKQWSANWVEKLKEDQREAKAELAVLVVTCLPPRVRGIGQVEGVWVCEPAYACPLAAALRQGLISVEVQRTQQDGRADKMSRAYDYLCGLEFHHQIEGIVESFVALQDQVAGERRAFERQWKEREAQLKKALEHTAMLYGRIQGIAGRASLPQIQLLELPNGDQEAGACAVGALPA